MRSLLPSRTKKVLDPKLVEIENAIHGGNYKKAQELLEDYHESNKHDKATELLLEAKQSELYFWLGELQEAANRAKKVTSQVSMKILDAEQKETRIILMLAKMDAMIVEGQIHVKQGNLNAASQQLKECKSLYNSILTFRKKIPKSMSKEILKRKIKINFLNGSILQKKGEFQAALDIFLSIKATLEDIQIPLNANLLNALGITYSLKGQLQEALESFRRCLELLKDSGDHAGLIRVYNNIGQILWQQRQYEEALNYYMTCLELSKKLNIKQHSAIIMSNIGLIQWNISNLDLALEYFEKSLNLFRELGMEAQVAFCLNNIGAVYTQKGELDKALHCHKQSLEIVSKYNQLKEKAAILNNIGLIYFEKGQYITAEEYLEKCLEIQKQQSDTIDASETLCNLVLVCQSIAQQQPNKDYQEKASDWLKELENLASNNKDKPAVTSMYHLTKALILMKKKRFRDMLHAHRTLSEIINKRQVRNPFLIQAIKALGELKVVELGISENEQEILKELKDLISRLFDIAKEQNSYLVLIDAYLLQARLHLIEFKVEAARRILQAAQDFAEEKGLKTQAMVISHEHDKILNQSEEWNELIQQDASIMERIELAELEQMFFSQIRNEKEILERENEKPILFLIISNHGLSLHSYSFIEDQNFSELLISGFITAINAMSTQILSEQGTLERIKHDEYTILLKPIENYLFCYAFQGPSYFATKKLNKLINSLMNHSIIWSQLQESYQTGKEMNAKLQKEVNEIINQVINQYNDELQDDHIKKR